MRKIGLTVYGISVLTNMNQRNELHNIFGKSLIAIIKDFATGKINNYTRDDQNEKLFTFELIETEQVKNNEGQDSYELLYGRVKTGEFGIESELVNINTGDTYTRTADQADIMPFGFCIAIPNGNIDNAVIVLQTVGIYGMKTSLQEQLKECIKEIDSDLRINIGVIVPRTYIDRFFEHGVLQSIRMIRYEIPQDDANRIGINYGVKQTYEERIIRKPLGFMERNQRKLDEWKRGQRSYTDVVEIDNFEYDDLKLDFKLGRTNKSISLKNVDNIAVTEDVTDLVDQVGGHPTFSSIKAVMKDTAKEYLIGKGLIPDEEKG